MTHYRNQGLLDVTCKTVANMIKGEKIFQVFLDKLLFKSSFWTLLIGKTPEEIRKTFNIKNDFTPRYSSQSPDLKKKRLYHLVFHLSEEEQVRKENEWCEEK